MHRQRIKTILLTVVLAQPAILFADDAKDETFRFEAGMLFSRFEQQVQDGLDGAPGDRIVETMEFSFTGMGTYNFWEFLSGGIFMRFDAGDRSTGRFSGFDSGGGAVTSPSIGGSYWELWLGPLLRAQYNRFFFEFGHGTFTTRSDNGRPDVPAQGGATVGNFTTTPGFSWMIAVGGEIPFNEQLSLTLRMEYRLRYYTTRGGKDLQNGIAHGTQSYSPSIGVAYRL